MAVAARKKKTRSSTTKRSKAPGGRKKVARAPARKTVVRPARTRPAARAKTTHRRAVHSRGAVDSSLTREQMRLEANKELVLAFYRKMIGEKDPEGARAYMGEPYRQHSPYAKDGFEGVAEFARMFKRDFPQHHYEVKRVIAEGDYVVLHLHGKSGPNPHGEAVVDLFRVKNGKVVEHWDVIQPLPEKYENPNSPF